MSSTTPAGLSFDHNDPAVPGPEVRNTYTGMREACPVVHSERYGGFDFLTRYADVRAALGDSASYSSADGVLIPSSGLPPIPALDFDEPLHSQWRAVMEAPLTLRAVRALEPTITEVADLLIDEFADADSADLVPQFAEPLPAIIIGRMVGLNQQQAVESRAMAAALFASIATDDFPARMGEFAAFTQQQLASRRSEPRDDFLTAMASGTVEGMAIDDVAATGLMVAYLIGGHHSTSSGISGLIRHVLTVPGLREEITGDPKTLPRVVEESLRMTTPLQLFARTTRCPVSVGGQELPPGRRIMLNLASANRDPREFEKPETFDAHRARNRHVAFGAGAHICLGLHLARAEMRLATGRLLERLPDLQINGDVTETGLIGGALMTLASLPVSFTPGPR